MRKYIKHLIILIIGVLGFSSLSGCDFDNYSYYGAYSYKNSNTYNVGEMIYENDDIVKLDISYISGYLSIVESSNNKFKMSEKISSENRDYSVRSKISEDTLYIKFFKSGISTTKYVEKVLTLEVPSRIYESIVIDTVSADVNLDLSFKDLTIDSVSGSLNINLNSKDSNLYLDTVSGNATINLANEVGYQLKFKTLSGIYKSDFSEGYTYLEPNVNVKFESVSGNCYIKAKD